MLSPVLPYRWAVAPQELLPSIPPSVQLGWVEGSGPKRRPCGSRWALRTSSTTPGCTIALRRSRSTCSISWQYFDQSITSAVLRALARQAGAPTAGEHGRRVPRSHPDGGRGGVGVLGRRRRPGPAGSSRRPWSTPRASVVEADLAVDGLAEFPFQRVDVDAEPSLHPTSSGFPVTVPFPCSSASEVNGTRWSRTRRLGAMSDEELDSDVEVTLTASRALVGVVARTLVDVLEVVTLPAVPDAASCCAPRVPCAAACSPSGSASTSRR